MLEGSSCSYCDLCARSIPSGHSLWTCLNRNNTIFHANAFDVCDVCLMQHALNLNEEGMARFHDVQLQASRASSSSTVEAGAGLPVTEEADRQGAMVEGDTDL